MAAPALQSFETCPRLRRGPAPPHSSHDVGPVSVVFVENGLAGIVPSSSFRVRYRLLGWFPRSASPLKTLLRGAVPRTSRPVDRVCTEGLLADRVHPRWLSWDFVASWRFSSHRRDPGHSLRPGPSSLRSESVLRFASGATRRKVSLPAARRDALSELCPPAGLAPVSRRLLSCGSRDVRSNRSPRARYRASIPGSESVEVLE